jgi:hypothetical protein
MEETDRLALAVATVTAFAERAAAQRVVLVLDRGEEAAAAMVEWVPDEPPAVTEGEETRRATDLPEVPPAPLPELRPAPASALAADPDTGELSAPLGTIAHLAGAVMALARAFGGRTVATAEFATRDPELPLTIAAREGEPMVLSLAGRLFELPE